MLSELLFGLKRAARALAGRPPLEVLFGLEAESVARHVADITAISATLELCEGPGRRRRAADHVFDVVRAAALDGLDVLAKWEEDERRLRREQPRPLLDWLTAAVRRRPRPRYSFHVTFRRASGEFTYRTIDAVSHRAAQAEAERRIREGDVIGIYEDERIPDIRGAPGDVVHSILLTGRCDDPPEQPTPCPF